MNSITRFWGKVRQGQKRGRILGFPTANLNLHQSIPEGIYISFIKYDKHIYPSTTFIGSSKTFEETEYKAETYIHDFNRNIYGEYITVWLIQKIRPNKTFKSTNDLIIQIKQDIRQSKDYHAQG